jgi:membrane protein
MHGVGNKEFVKELWGEIKEDNLTNSAAALSYYLFLSIFPAAIFLLSLLPYLPIPNLQQALLGLLHQAMPEKSASLFENIVLDVTSKRQGGLLTFGILFTLWSASNGIYALMQQLNITYDVKESRPFWKVRGTAIVLLFMFVVLVVGAFALVVFGGVIQDLLAKFLGRGTALLAFFAVVRWAIIAFSLLVGFAIVYYFGPVVEQRFRFVSPGSVIGAALLVLISLGFRFYIANFSNYGATYGSLGTVIIMMLWLYIMGLIALIGSEINAVLERHHPAGKSKGEAKFPPTPSGKASG